MKVLAARILTAAVLILISAGCSTSGTPTNQNAPSTLTSNAQSRLAVSPCPASGITFAQGNNGTWTVPIMGTCDLIAPVNHPCGGHTAGVVYTFDIASGSQYGSLNQQGNVGVFKRTSKGEVVVDLNLATYIPPGCGLNNSVTYGYVDLTTP